MYVPAPKARVLATLCGLCSAGLAGACSDIDNLHDRTAIVNKGAADYYNEAILLNIVRASKSEPLTFVAMTTYTGHNSVSGSAGLPTVTVGPHTPAAITPERNYAFGANSVTRSYQNDWNASIVDDPATYAALLAPTNPSTLGFFINQGFSRELLFLLFVDHLIITDMHKNVTEEYLNTPFSVSEGDAINARGESVESYQQATFECFQTFLTFMIQEGFTAEVDIDAIPAGRTYIPANRFCADLDSNVWFKTDREPNKACTGILPIEGRGGPVFSLRRPSRPPRLSPSCSYQANWTEAKTSSSSGSTQAAPSASSSANQSVPLATASATSATPSRVTMSVPQLKGADTKTQTVEPTGTATTDNTRVPVTVSVSTPISIPKQKPNPSDYLKDPCTQQASKIKVGGARAAYEMCIDGYIKVKLYLRSAFGVYQYLGKMFERKMELGLYTGREDASTVLNITHDDNFCFTNTQFEGERYCVPVDSYNTKRIFALLRQLVALNTTVQNGQPTLTVRSLPQ
jgi:hypothetical protein